MKTNYPFPYKEEQYSRYTMGELYFALADARAAAAGFAGWNEPAALWYLDDVHTIRREINRRNGLLKEGR